MQRVKLIVRAASRNEGAATRAYCDQSLFPEGFDGLAYCGSAYAKLFAQLAFRGQLIADIEFSGQNAPLNLLDNLLVKPFNLYGFKHLELNNLLIWWYDDSTNIGDFRDVSSLYCGSE